MKLVQFVLPFSRSRLMQSARRSLDVRLCLSLVMLLTHVPSAISDDLTPSSNLVGINAFHERIVVNLSLKGAEEFQVDADEVKKTIRKTLSLVGIGTDASGLGVPMLYVLIAGESTGGGGADYRVELVVRATVPSPFARNRSIYAILWRTAVTGRETMHYDPASKDVVKPSGPINERVYASVRDAGSQLCADLKKPN